MLPNTKDNLHLDFVKLLNEQLRIYLGLHQINIQTNHMMNQCRRLNGKIISVHQDFTVLKLYVHHVVLLLLGLSSQKLNPLQIFWPSWNKFSIQRNQDQIIFVLIKHVWYFGQLSEMDLGTESGKKQPDLLLMLIITSITEMMMSFAKKWCNPAPADGSAPNLVVEAKDK